MASDPGGPDTGSEPTTRFVVRLTIEIVSVYRSETYAVFPFKRILVGTAVGGEPSMTIFVSKVGIPIGMRLTLPFFAMRLIAAVPFTFPATMMFPCVLFRLTFWAERVALTAISPPAVTFVLPEDETVLFKLTEAFCMVADGTIVLPLVMLPVVV